MPRPTTLSPLLTLRERERAETETKMIKLRPKRFSRSNSKLAAAAGGGGGGGGAATNSGGEIKWELRPGGMLVQKRDSQENAGEVMITIRVSTVSQWHDISVQATSTFGNTSNSFILYIFI